MDELEKPGRTASDSRVATTERRSSQPSTALVQRNAVISAVVRAGTTTGSHARATLRTSLDEVIELDEARNSGEAAAQLLHHGVAEVVSDYNDLVCD